MHVKIGAQDGTYHYEMKDNFVGFERLFLRTQSTFVGLNDRPLSTYERMLLTLPLKPRQGENVTNIVKFPAVRDKLQGHRNS